MWRWISTFDFKKIMCCVEAFEPKKIGHGHLKSLFVLYCGRISLLLCLILTAIDLIQHSNVPVACFENSDFILWPCPNVHPLYLFISSCIIIIALHTALFQQERNNLLNYFLRKEKKQMKEICEWKSNLHSSHSRKNAQPFDECYNFFGPKFENK